MKKKLKIFIVDDHQLFTDSLELLIDMMDIGIIVGKANNGQEFLQALDVVQPDLVLMDLSMPDMDGLETAKKALNKYPGLKILIVTMHSENEHYQELVTLGVKGIVLKSSGKEILEKAIINIVAGESYFSNEFLRNIIKRMDTEKAQGYKSIIDKLGITPRELEILENICSGLTSKEIAEKLFLSEKTIAVHRNSLLKKTQSRNTTALILYAIKNKIIDCERLEI